MKRVVFVLMGLMMVGKTSAQTSLQFPGKAQQAVVGTAGLPVNAARSKTGSRQTAIMTADRKTNCPPPIQRKKKNKTLSVPTHKK